MVAETQGVAGVEWCGREPYRWQTEALDAVTGAWWHGTKSPLVHACTGSGKTLVIAELAARTEGRVLVTTPTMQLVEQLYREIEKRCPGEVGRAYSLKWEAGARIVITTKSVTIGISGSPTSRTAWRLTACAASASW